MITIILLAMTGYLSFHAGRRYQRGRVEIDNNRRQVAREERGRRGAMKLRPIKIRR